MNVRCIQILVFCCILSLCNTRVIHRTVTDSDCQVIKTQNDCIVNCQNRNLRVIPQDLPNETTILNLDYNYISKFGGEQLLHYHSLKSLSLKANSISYVDKKALYGVPHLYDLDISGNNISHIPDKTFSILPHLRKLYIGSNLFNVTPDNALNLPKLEMLGLASLNKNGNLQGSVIGAGFNRLKGLRVLGLSDNGLTTLPNGYFTHLRNISLQKIILVANNMTKIERHAFDKLKTVVTVMLNLNDFNNTDIEESLYGIYKTNLTSLSLEFSTKLHTITNTTFKYLRRTKVKSLDISYSNLEHVLDNAFNNITTLEKISMGSNFFTELNDYTFAWLPALKNVNLTYNPNLTSLNRAFAGIGLTNLDLSQTGLEQIPNGTFHGTDKMTNLSLNENLRCLNNDSFLGLSSLTYLDLTDNSDFKHYDLHAFRGLNSLDTLLIDGMEMSNFTTPICEDLRSLKHLIADNISMEHLPDDSFKQCDSLISISMKGCDQLRDIGLSLRNISKLRLLEFSANKFNEHKPGAFNISEKFGTLIYQRIRNSANDKIITRIPSAIQNCTHMDILDISYNNIKHLNDTDIQFFDKLKWLRAYHNPYNCSCDMLDVIKWFQANLEKINTKDNYSDYTCSAPPKMTSQTLKNFNRNVCRLAHKFLALEIVGPFAVLGLFGLISGVWAYWNKSMLAYFYWHYRTKKNPIEEDSAQVLNPNIKYDAFLSYSYENMAFVKNVLLKNLETSNEQVATIFKQIYDDIKDDTSKLSTCVLYCSKVYANYLKMCNGRIINKSSFNRHQHMKNKNKTSHKCTRSHNVTENNNNHRKSYLHSRGSKSCKTKNRHCCQNSKSQIFGFRKISYTNDTEKYRNFVGYSTRKIKKLKRMESIYKGHFQKVEFTVEKMLNMADSQIRNENTPMNETYTSLDVNHFTELPIGKIANMYGYKLMTCHRDFPVGPFLAETIVEYMERSRKSIICLSEDYIKGKWTMFEYEITVRERPKDMLVILLDDLDMKKLPRQMSNVLKKRLFLQWTPNDVYGKKLFFEKLRRFLGKPLKQIMDEKRKIKSEQNPDGSILDMSDTESDMTSIVSEDEDAEGGEWVSVVEPTLVTTIFQGDRDQILDTSKDISDNIMNICLNIMKKDHPDLFGDVLNMSNTTVATAPTERNKIHATQPDPPRREWRPFLEVIENTSRHWLIVSTHDCIEGVIRVYDSKSNMGISDNLQFCIARLVQKYKLWRLTLHIMNVPDHESEYDSGLHTLANIMFLMRNVDLTKLEYADSSQMRQHLITCLENEPIQITPFPAKPSKKGLFWWKKEVKSAIKQTKPIDLYCVCHMPWDSHMKKCVKCLHLFHPHCVQVKIITTFMCLSCKS